MSVIGAPDGRERRSAPRKRAIEEHGIETVCVRPGREAAVVNVSTAGILIETMHRLLPGTTIELQLSTTDRRASIRGAVVRSMVAGLHHGRVLYRGAIAFEGPIAPFRHVDGYPVPARNATPNRHDREDATPPTL